MTTEQEVLVDGKRTIDEEKDLDLILDWYKQAEMITSPEGAKELSERLLGGFNHDLGSMCHAAAAVAYASIKAVDTSEQSVKNGGFTDFQRNMIMWLIVQQITGVTEEPMRIMRFGELLKPGGWHNFNVLSRSTMTWLFENATALLADPEEVKLMSKDQIKHLKSIAEGKIPKGFTLESRQQLNKP